MNVSPLQTHENKIGSQMITPGSLIKEREVQKYAVVCLAYQKRKVTWLSYKYHRLQIDKVHKQHCWGVGGGRGCCMIKNEMSDRQVGNEIPSYWRFRELQQAMYQGSGSL